MRWMLLVPCGDVPWHSKCTANSANISPALTPLVALVYLAVVLVTCTYMSASTQHVYFLSAACDKCVFVQCNLFGKHVYIVGLWA